MLGRESNPSQQAIETNIMNDQNDYDHNSQQQTQLGSGSTHAGDSHRSASTDGTATNNNSRQQRRSRRDQARQQQLADDQRLLEGRRQQRQQRLQQRLHGDG